MPIESDAQRTGRLDDANALALEELVTANHESNRTMLALVEHVRLETEARGRKIDVLERNHRQMRNLVFLVCGTVAILMVIAVVNALNIASSRDQQQRIQAINELMLDCVNSTGQCGQANAVRQSEILQTVKQYELTGFYCIRTNPALEDPKGLKFLACMDKLYPGGPTLNGR